MKASCFVLTACVFIVAAVFGDEVTTVLVMEGKTVTLNTDVPEQHEAVLWYYNDTLIALINGEASVCLYDGEDGRFRDRLDVDYETGSLTITNIRPEDAGRYEAELIRSESKGTSQRLNRYSKCDSTKITRKMCNIGDTDTIKIFSVTVKGPDKTKEEVLEMWTEEIKSLPSWTTGLNVSPDSSPQWHPSFCPLIPEAALSLAFILYY